jgi:hypothetical protein
VSTSSVMQSARLPHRQLVELKRCDAQPAPVCLSLIGGLTGLGREVCDSFHPCILYDSVLLLF